VLTPEGGHLIRGLFPLHAAVIEEAMQGLTAEEQSEATGLLRRLGVFAAQPDGLGKRGEGSGRAAQPA
jgi:MarR family 2-MHQ and catechol resistance regulon transcriptional repressor